MATIKILTWLGLMLLPALLIFRDWKFHDRRTRRHHKLTRYILIAWFVLAIINAIFYWIEVSERSRLEGKVDDLVIGKRELKATVDDLVIGKNELLSQNRELISQNRDLAASISKYQTDLKEKEARIKELEISAKMSSRGVTSMYDFNGAKRKTAGGMINMTAGPEVEIFNRMRTLKQSGDYQGLIDLCEQQIEKTPDWLTPYLFAGVAYANIGAKVKAVMHLRHVADNAPGDPNYVKASTLLQQLESRP